MEANCEGCAGCCVDWRAVSPHPSDHERRGPREPLDDAYNLVPLTRDEVRAFLDAGLGDAMTPRLWRAGDAAAAVTVDGVEVAALDGRPAFFVGLRKPPKPVSPFGIDRTWLPTCAFLDPETLQCRIHDSALYPDECDEYPGHNLVLGRETECERVEEVYGGDRLLDATTPEDLRGLLLGPHAVGAKLFGHPDPGDLDGVVERIAAGEPTSADRASFVAVAAASTPGTLEVNAEKRAAARERALAADSWVGRAAAGWAEHAGPDGSPAADAPDGATVEEARGAPGTPGWDAVRDRTGDPDAGGGNG
jgi:Fe-S-cluster containining protein